MSSLTKHTYRWIETIKLTNGTPQNLYYHQQRMNNTLLFYGKDNKISLHDFFINRACTIQGTVKARIIYDINEVIDFSFTSYQLKKIKSFSVIENSDIHYSFKSEDRKVFEDIQSSVITDEIIITQNGLITDTSFSNLIFKKNNQWFTPNTFLLNGTKRQQLLNDKKIIETEISMNNIQTFPHFKLINAMIDMNEGEIFETKVII